MPLQEGKVIKRHYMKIKSRKIGLILILMAVTINMCSFSTVFAADNKQIASANNAQSIISVNNIQPIAATSNIQIRGIGVLPVYYRVVNVKTIAPEWISVGVADGIPTMTLAINRSQAIAVTYSGTFGATYGQINTAVGWTYGQNVMVEIAGHYRVPTTFNGHKVKSGTLIAYAERSVKSYQVERHNEVGGITRSTGTAKKMVNHLCYKAILHFTDGGSVTISV